VSHSGSYLTDGVYIVTNYTCAKNTDFIEVGNICFCVLSDKKDDREVI